MYDDVLVATDGSDVARRAASQGLAVAETVGARVHVLSVADVPDGSRWDDLRDRLRADCRTYVDDVARSAADRGIAVEERVRDGTPHHEILAHAEEHDVDLVVLGTHGRTGVRRWIIGSVATSVVRDACRPVLTVNVRATDVPRRFDEILVATDGRPGANAAVEHGIALAETYDATVHAVYVVDDSVSRLPAVLGAFERVGAQATTDVTVRAAEHGVDVVRAVERGVPHVALTDYAADNRVDLVVLGTEGRTGLAHLALGSVSQRVVGTAPAPVLTVRAGSGDRS